MNCNILTECYPCMVMPLYTHGTQGCPPWVIHTLEAALSTAEAVVEDVEDADSSFSASYNSPRVSSRTADKS